MICIRWQFWILFQTHEVAQQSVTLLTFIRNFSGPGHVTKYSNKFSKTCHLIHANIGTVTQIMPRSLAAIFFFLILSSITTIFLRSG